MRPIRLQLEDMEGEMSFNTAMALVIGLACIVYIWGLYLLHLKKKNIADKSSN